MTEFKEGGCDTKIFDSSSSMKTVIKDDILLTNQSRRQSDTFNSS